MKPKKLSGKIIIPPGAFPEKHELMTASALTQRGKVEFIRPSRTKGVKNPDILYLGKIWEIKCPKGNSRWTIQEQLRRAVKQSPNVILDMRRSKMSDYEVKRLIKNHFSKHQSIKNIILITQKNLLIDYHQ